MNAKEVNSTFDLVSYASGIVNLKKSGGYYYGPCPVCGGNDRFQIKRTQSGDVWICRKCSPEKYRSAIDFLMAYHTENFREALQRGGGEVQAPRRELGTGKPVTSPAPVQVLPDEVWQREAWKLIDDASNMLTSDEAGEPGRRYLLARGISKGSMYANLLGFAMIGTRPAIVIPWLDLGDVVTAIKYRYIDQIAQDEKGKRFSMMPGSMPHLFGLQHILDSDKILLFVEGELNAASVLQTRPAGVSVISGGSEGNGNAALLRALAKHYNRVVIWTDDPAKGKTIRERMNRPEARLLKSPVLDGVKYDANQMLQTGLLMEFISAELSTVCQGVPVDTMIVEYMNAKADA
jgi:hypothetical protein